MRILLVTSECPPKIGGIATYVASLATELVKRNHEVGLITGIEQTLPLPAGSLAFQLALPLATATRWRRWFSNGWLLTRKVLEFRPDLVHFASAGLAVYARWLPRAVPFVVTVHGKDLTMPWQKMPRKNRLFRRIDDSLRASSQIIAVSEITARMIRARLGAIEIRVIHPGCDLARFVPSHVSPRPAILPLETRPIVLTVGRLVPRKGHLNLLSGLEKTGSDFRWVIVGDGPYAPTISAAISRSFLRERISLLGAVSDDDLPSLYRASSVFALTPVVLAEGADFEGFGLVYHEAAASGLPSIASNVGGCAEAVLAEWTGLLVSSHDPLDIASAVDRLLSDESFRRALGRAAQEHVIALGGWTHLAEEMETVYASSL